MPRRVSLKGKGADIFFGDYTPEPAPAAEPQAEPAAPAPSAAAPPEGEAQPSSPPRPRQRASTRARVHARTDASAGADTTARVRTAMRAELAKKLQFKQRLASYTFRFRPEELDQLDRVLAQLEQGDGQRPSKNDLVRLGLLWLLADYDEQGDASVLAQVLART